MRIRMEWSAAILFAACLISRPGAAAASPVDFQRDIRPILSENCFTCHGPDERKRKAGLRLDQRQGAFADLGGYAAVVPGKVEESRLFQRITEANEDDRMPPVQSGKKLTAAQIEQLKNWIAEGATWQEHWSLVPPKRPALPAVKKGEWPRNPIDHFVLARLEAEGLTPSPEANKEALIRRLTLDLTGLPPTVKEIDAFRADTRPEAYELLVERLLRSPRYGEHMARQWLDAARYGDTHGLHLDNERSIWPYRDWVIRAFNANQRFDQFTIEQLAGDLLPDPTLDQLIATGFNRCNVTTSEGGAIPEEFAARYAVDRVETTASVWMGLTAGCAACHSHKFDPLSQQEFYQLYAFFNSLDENPMDGNARLPPPVVKIAGPEQERQLATFDQKVRMVEAAIKAALGTIDYQDPLAPQDWSKRERREYVWLDDAWPAGAKPSTDEGGWQFVSAPEHPVFSGQKSHRRSGEKGTQHLFTEAPAPLLVGQGDKLFAYVYLDPKQPPKAVMLQFNTGNWDHRAVWGEDIIEYGQKDTPGRRHLGPLPAAGQWARLEVDAGHVGLPAGTKIQGWAFTQYGGTVYWDMAGIVSRVPQGDQIYESLSAWEVFQREREKPDLPGPVLEALRKPPAERGPADGDALSSYYVEHVYRGARVVFEPLHQQKAKLAGERLDYDHRIPRSLITRELKQPRPTYLLKRGQYDMKGEQVYPDVPAALPPLPKDSPTNRLGLARWLVSPQHPLTSRVAVNRVWQQHFGTGIVKTSEDFGSQGEPPSHPELLDWLATEFVAQGWDVKALHRLMVTSATYRQSSALTPPLWEKDPENRWLARGPRFRMDAEMVRDTVLSVSGLLVERIGGPGVKPYQPDNIWEPVAYPTSNTAKYQKDEGEALFRRSLYTFWKRTAPPPSMTLFDAPDRESCRVRRERTNTPLQALALLNDVQYIEAARHLAGRMIHEGGAEIAQRVAHGFRLATSRPPETRETEVLCRLYQTHLDDFKKNPDAARQLLEVGDTPADPRLDATELASWTLVANALLNLSETITLN